MKIEIVRAIHGLLNVNIFRQNDISFCCLFFLFYSYFFLNSFLLELEGQQNKLRQLSTGFFRKQSEMKEKKRHISPFPPNWFKATIYTIHISLCNRKCNKVHLPQILNFFLCLRKPTKCRNWPGYYSHTRVEAVRKDLVSQLNTSLSQFSNILSLIALITWLEYHTKVRTFF